jgi:hypothetical protein
MCSTRERGAELASQPGDHAGKTDARQPVLVIVWPTRERGGELAPQPRDDDASGERLTTARV